MTILDPITGALVTITVPRPRPRRIRADGAFSGA
jgi:hypothetical protein